VLAKIAQDCHKESNLAHQKAESAVNAFCDEAEKRQHVAKCEIDHAKELCDKAVAEAQHKIIVEQVFVSTKAKEKAFMTRKQHAKELLLKQRECDITIHGMKCTMLSALKRKDKINSSILQKQVAKSRVVIKRCKTDNATSKATICNLEQKVATFEATLEQLKRSHENAMIDLMPTHRRKVRSIHS